MFLFVSVANAADDCLGYKISPIINLKQPEWEENIIQPLEHTDILHGDVIATLVNEFEITGDITSIEDGFCVALKNIDATIGYSDFMVQIDIFYQKDSCEYNAILQHEDEHIRAYLSVIEDNQNLFKKSIQSAAESITPVFVKNEQDIESAIDKLNEQLQNHPDIILLKQKIKADEEIRNKYVDLNDTGKTLKKCFK
ncbi:MAG: hypothetical protein IJQ55_00485 [Alphaproteobacteria bacterium]|nr:hypothetical protein [Alphaproteobacteria bacterium]